MAETSQTPEAESDKPRDLGLGLTVFELDERAGAPEPTPPGVVRLGVHRAGSLPEVDPEAFDVMLTYERDAPRPWVSAPRGRLEETLAALRDAVDRAPIAAGACVQVLRMTLSVRFAQSLVLESLAYSALLASAEFRLWRARTPRRARGEDSAARVGMVRADDGALHIRLTRPNARNAVDAAMRDALVEAFEFAVIDPYAAPIVLSGEGPSFSAGGDLNEFGLAGDVGVAHLIRVQQAPVRLLHQCRDRVTAHVHGACIGAGIELPAAAGRVVAARSTFFRLPELSMGLIPGAGGTASIPRRIGRHRACYMALSGQDIDVATALFWGLADEVDEAA